MSKKKTYYGLFKAYYYEIKFIDYIIEKEILEVGKPVYSTQFAVHSTSNQTDY
ncbi:hypothetical protein [Aquimarina sp. BL5]|uniref:hypothetical protein n=1 Tax=Aquimarina sp. BL5 TaxID=1714860 RepID=UPI0013C30DF3|nr:hypothetical protein [Aquimarina sp. BL5]